MLFSGVNSLKIKDLSGEDCKLGWLLLLRLYIKLVIEFETNSLVYNYYYFCVVGPGPLYIKAFALRGTLYTLISKVDEAVRDLTQVINAEDGHASTKVDCPLSSAAAHVYCDCFSIKMHLNLQWAHSNHEL